MVENDEVAYVEAGAARPTADHHRREDRIVSPATFKSLCEPIEQAQLRALGCRVHWAQIGHTWHGPKGPWRVFYRPIVPGCTIAGANTAATRPGQ